MRSSVIALVCGLALVLGSSTLARASSHIVFAHDGRLNFVSPNGRELGQIKQSGGPIALSASDNGRYIAVLPRGEFDDSEDEVDEGVYYSASVHLAGRVKPRRVVVGYGSRDFGAAPPPAPSLAISPDGRFLAFSGGRTIRIINLDTGRRWTLKSPHGANFQASFSSDGRHLVFVHRNTTCRAARCQKDIFSMALNGSSRRRLTDDPEEELFPVTSPDRKWLAFLRRTPQAFELVTKRVGSDQERVIRQVPCLLSRPDFSPDGKRIVYAWTGSRECAFQRMTVFTAGIDGRGTRAVARDIAGGQLLPQWTQRPVR